MGDIGPLQIKPSKVVPDSYFWGRKGGKVEHRVTGYHFERSLMPDTTRESWRKLLDTGTQLVQTVLNAAENTTSQSSATVREIHLSEELQTWREDQHHAGRTLPPKGYGISRAAQSNIDLLGAGDWPECLLTNGALYGCGIANLLLGGYNPEVVFSNYCTDMGFYHEHGYSKVFPEFEPVLDWAVIDPEARKTLGGTDRREVTQMGLIYTRSKCAAEEKAKGRLAHRVARLNRAQISVVMVCENSILGLSAESMARGFDQGSVIADCIFSNPGTDVVDVGSDLCNSEMFNSLLNTKDITDTGIVSEEALRRVYDGYAHTCARIFTQRWAEPGARICSMLYVWHILNDRHNFLRRAVLGSTKMRAARSGQREAVFEEAFDEDFHTTGLSRPLGNACNGGIVCDHVQERFHPWGGNILLKELWDLLVVQPVEYVYRGVVDEEKENDIIEELRVSMAQVLSYGLADEMAWLLAHASQHAWQVNYLFEAAMFGSLLDDGGLKGRLDRFE